MKEKERKELTLNEKIFYSIFSIIIGFGYFWVIFGIIIHIIFDPSINDLYIIFYVGMYFILLTIPSKFVWDAIKFIFGNIKLRTKWLIMLIAIIIPLLYPILLFLDLWIFKKTIKIK